MKGESYDVVVVGAGHGGAQAAIALRQNGFGGTIALISDEPELPYEHPPLSKDYLTGKKPFDRLLLRPPAFWVDREVAILSGRKVVQVDPIAHEVACADGGRVGYRRLIWSAGGRPRRMSCEGFDLAGVHSVRTRSDVDQLRTEIADARRAVIVGGGYIGLETAAAFIDAGLTVTVIEAQNRILARVAGGELSHFFEREHRSRGVDIRLETVVTCLNGTAGRVSGVRLSDGGTLAADIVVVGIGIEPSVEPLLAAGADGGDGVSVDAHCRTTLRDVYAVGDCAHHSNRYAGGARLRLESVQNANDMAATVAKGLTGQSEPYDSVPWFWSNQYDLRLQTVGLSVGHDAAAVRGDPATRSFSVVYLRAGEVVALDCVNMPRDYVQGRALVERRARVAIEALADQSLALKDIAAVAA